MNILLVEDDPSAAQVMCVTMKKAWKQEVTQVSTGRAAVQAAENQNFDLVLLDIMLPDGFGYTFIPEIRKHQPDLKIITMTGHNTPEMEKRIWKHSITYYMAKPVNFKELKDIIDHIASKTAA